jgi:hypothetical protein
MSTIPFILIPFVEYLVPTGIGLWLALLILKKKLTRDMLISWLTPICLWGVLAFSTGRGSLSNLFLEPLMLAGVVLVLSVVRIVLAGRKVVEEKALGLLTASVLLVSAVCNLFPNAGFA